MAKVLVIRLTSLGDVIFTLPLVNALEKNNNEIGYLVAEKGLDVIKNNPAISKIHFVPLAKWKKRPFSLKTFMEFFQIIKEIRKEKYDIALDCQQMFKSLFLFLFCGAKRRITFRDARELSFLGGNEFVKSKAKFRDKNYHIVERNLDFARHLGIRCKEIKFPIPEPSNEIKHTISAYTFANSKPLVVIAPATTWQNKHWAEENWAKLIEAIHQKCNIIFTGTDFDKPLVERILSKTNSNINYTNLLGKTDVAELMELFSRAKIVISPDSGSAHLAWLSANPAVITIFTCTSANRFGPYGNPEKYFSISSTLPCQPCFKKKCILQADKNICTNYPSATEIINIVNNLL